MTKNLTRRIIHIAIAVLFVLFALVQINDPDFWIWMPAYGMVAFLAFAKATGRSYSRIGIVLLVIYSIWGLTYLPAVVNWIQMGMPSITEKMKADEPHIEFIREFGGLLICLPPIIFYAFFNRSQSS